MYVVKTNGRRIFFDVARGRMQADEDEQCDNCGTPLIQEGSWVDMRGRSDMDSAHVRCGGCGAVFPATRWYAGKD